MKEFKVSPLNQDQKLIRYLEKILKNAGSGFLYKMLRKKNITLNGKKASGNETLQAGDMVKIFFSDETFAKMSGMPEDVGADNLYSINIGPSKDRLQAGEIKERPENNKSEGSRKVQPIFPRAPFQIQVLYEDDDLLAVNKPSGLLSQKSDRGQASMNEYLIRYCLDQGEMTEADLQTFRPSVVNRLDRNTSGILLFGKTMRGLHLGSELVKSHEGQKTYHCIVTGDSNRFKENTLVKGWLLKDPKKNMVRYSAHELDKGLYMEEEVRLLKKRGPYSLLEVLLHTGRSHQIRSSLSALGCPIVNDRKYGGVSINYNTGQLLHACGLTLPNGVRIHCPDPDIFSELTGEERK
ncbi:MAG: RluA family pseudouridine synthase [Lachnospiraceae bacterium]|nr:RluA family pseudouridine synthase [Lachnospiraceae bacterium]